MADSAAAGASRLGALSAGYFGVVLGRPGLTLACAALVVLGLALGVRDFRLDASPESLVLEQDTALEYYRSVSARYGGNARLAVVYTPQGHLFAPTTLREIQRLRDDLAALEAVDSVTSLLDVPLLRSPPVSLAELQQGRRTLLSPDADLALARREFTESPLYRNVLVGEAGRTTALYVGLRADPERERLSRERDALLEARLERSLTREEQARLDALSDAVRERSAAIADRLIDDIARIRAVAGRYRDGGEVLLAGGPLIVADTIGFVRHDLRVFGTAVAVFMVALLAVAFRRPRWVLVPSAICAGAGLAMVGLLGWTGWRPTVVSSNFLSVLLVVTLSLVVHLVVRYQELHERSPDASQRDLVQATIASKFAPSSYTALTTMVAFGSLVVSGIRPVIDFGWMMVIGIALSFVLTFTVFPAALMLLPPGAPPRRRGDASGRLMGVFAGVAGRHGRAALVVAAAVLALGAAGVMRLGVENRFIDYFDESTEIHRGMVAVDRNLGGTTPLDVILEPEPGYRPPEPLDLPYADELGTAGFTATSYWFNAARLRQLERVHAYLDALPDTGKVLSLATGMQVLEELNGGQPLGDFQLSILYGRLPEAIKDIVVDPYLSEDGDQARLSVRVFESSRGLRRDALLQKIRDDLTGRLGLAPEQVRLTGLLVLYNNVLQSLFRSQVLTLGFVFLAILVMFMVLFRSARVAALAMVPNILVAVVVLGAMGWAGISLDIMTITIAAIVLGIGVDDTIHYTHRYLHESRHDAGSAIGRAHASVGRAMLYTSLTIGLGFSIFALSAFVPLVYFGVLTALAMAAALLADLTVLPALLSRWGAARSR